MKNINPSCSQRDIVPYLYLLINCVNVSFIRFNHVHCLFLVYVRHFLNHVVILIFKPFWRPLWSSALGSRLVRLMVGPPLHRTRSLKYWLEFIVRDFSTTPTLLRHKRECITSKPQQKNMSQGLFNQSQDEDGSWGAQGYVPLTDGHDSQQLACWRYKGYHYKAILKQSW